MKTFSQKPAEVTRTWYHIDASGLPLGRVATQAAQLLLGKRKTTFTPHVDGGDFVIITNASQVVLTGKKGDEQLHHYSGYPGGLKSVKKADLRVNNPKRLVEHAVYGMIPTNKLKTDRMKRLKVYPTDQHEHSAQQPTTIEVKL
jgi:large subunit ribosomal protein L13